MKALNLTKLNSHNIQVSFEKLDLGHIDQIFNLACPASPIHYQKDHLSTLKTCFNGTENLLELAAKLNARFLHTSTSGVLVNIFSKTKAMLTARRGLR